MYFAAVKTPKRTCNGGEKMTSSQMLKAQRKQENGLQQHPEPQTCAVEWVQHNCVQTKRLFVIFGCKNAFFFGSLSIYRSGRCRNQALTVRRAKPA